MNTEEKKIIKKYLLNKQLTLMQKKRIIKIQIDTFYMKNKQIQLFYILPLAASSFFMINLNTFFFHQNTLEQRLKL